ncbi:hypothetical protein D9757_004913 [Collybiopsis confluens]|uniref:PUB domain-containing protein n=1 Tax=Collybiopsis confluens TaxID=2823264 RepID=A0A8H5HTB3_9AGAR|nr:hypothetical protein D9757_004913 [Collybiopsis confluens]
MLRQYEALNLVFLRRVLMESPPSAKLAEAVERRLSAQETQGPSPAEIAADHFKRQKFRRLLDPGIARPNTEAQFLESLKTLYKLADNLLREPEDPKFQRFKTTNSTITKNIIDPKGTVEYLRELGFYPEVVDFQPYYVFNRKRISDLRIGTAMLKESLDLYEEKRARATVSKQTVAEARAEAVEKVHLQFMEDRRTKMEIDEREKQLRQARAEIAARKQASTATEDQEPMINDDD